MFSFGPTEFLVTLLLLVFGVAFWPPKTRAFARRGWDPGFWGLKVWPARVYFFFKGHDVVETAYRDVRTPLWRENFRTDLLIGNRRKKAHIFYRPSLKMC